MYKIIDLFDLDHTIAKEYLSKYEYPWEALSGIKELIIELDNKLDEKEFNKVGENIWIHKTATVFPSAYIAGPCIIGANTEVRQCAFIRGSALVGEGCVVGNSCELKNVIIFDGAQVPHFSYCGDSILGYKAHMGAGSITSNLKSDKTLVTAKFGSEKIETGVKKFGAMLGDYVEVGCNSVLNPGTIVGRNSNIYPTSCVRGTVPENSIYKDNENIVTKK